MILNVMDNTDHYAPIVLKLIPAGRRIRDVQPLAKGILPGPCALGESVIDDDHMLVRGIVRVGEIAAFDHRGADGFEIAGKYRAIVGHSSILLLGRSAFGPVVF